MLPPYFTDAEVDEMTAGLEQNAAKVRHLQRMGLKVDRKPNGRPLAWRPVQAPQAEAQNQAPLAGVVGLQEWAKRRQQRGQKAQG